VIRFELGRREVGERLGVPSTNVPPQTWQRTAGARRRVRWQRGRRRRRANSHLICVRSRTSEACRLRPRGYPVYLLRCVGFAMRGVREVQLCPFRGWVCLSTRRLWWMVGCGARRTELRPAGRATHPSVRLSSPSVVRHPGLRADHRSDAQALRGASKCDLDTLAM